MKTVVEELREALTEAKATIKEQNKFLEELLAAPSVTGYVVSLRTGRATVSIPGETVEVGLPQKMADDKMFRSELKRGALVRVLKQEGAPPAILDILLDTNPIGDLAVASKAGNGLGEVEVEYQGSTRVIHYGEAIKIPEPGDRLLVDTNCIIAHKNYGPDESKFSYQGGTGVSWGDVGGLHLAKEILQEAIELPFKHPDLYKRFGKKHVKGVLLYGPPGCGKTMLAKAAATALSDVHHAKAADTGFIYVKGPELLDRYVGNTEAAIRGLFARARKHQKAHGYPAILFIDEADALLGKRGSRESLGIESTTVPQFLSEMDGLDTMGPMVLLATNRPDSLDSAVTRDGRIDRKVQVTRPDQLGAEEIFNLYLKNLPVAQGKNAEILAHEAAAYLYDAKYKLYSLVLESGKTVPFTLASLANGAMVAGMVDKATTKAMRREINNSRLSSDLKGLSNEDLEMAAVDIYRENLNLNHKLEIQEFVDNNKLSIQQVIHDRVEV